MRATLPKYVLLTIPILVLLGYITVNRNTKPQPPAPSQSPEITSLPAQDLTTTSQVTATTFKTIRARDIAEIPAEHRYSVEVPQDWQVEVVKEISALNLYDPNEAGSNNLEKSQVFIRYFSANSFLTLNTVTILERMELTISERQSVQYTIEKKPEIAPFPHQPTWRNTKHVVTDIRSSERNPAIFYVIAQRPGLREEIYTHLLNSIAPE